jgi:hypothetical protein
MYESFRLVGPANTKMIVTARYGMTPEAKTKLDRSRFYLDLMIKNKENDELFTNYLDAFLTVSRSALMIIEKELGKIQGFQSWYSNTVLQIDPERHFELFRILRNTSVHKRNIIPNMKVSVHQTLAIKTSVKITLIDKDGNVTEHKVSDDQPSPNNDTAISHQWVFEEKKDTDAIELCEQYYGKLQMLVQNCQTQYP